MAAEPEPPLPSISVLGLRRVGSAQLRFGGVWHPKPFPGRIAPHRAGCSDKGYAQRQRLRHDCCARARILCALSPLTPPVFTLANKAT